MCQQPDRFIVLSRFLGKGTVQKKDKRMARVFLIHRLDQGVSFRPVADDLSREERFKKHSLCCEEMTLLHKGSTHLLQCLVSCCRLTFDTTQPFHCPLVTIGYSADQDAQYGLIASCR
ncbi:MAG: hypothetical protein IPJ06_15995 [Saprospiraceae bacterium]|nr:hypothetical protein [Saprospiraceae bacterium]